MVGGVSSPENGNKLKNIYTKNKKSRLRRRRRLQSAEERVAQQHQQPARDTRLDLTMGTSDRFLFYFFKLLTSFCGFCHTVFPLPPARALFTLRGMRVVLTASWFNNRTRVSRTVPITARNIREIYASFYRTAGVMDDRDGALLFNVIYKLMI